MLLWCTLRSCTTCASELLYIFEIASSNTEFQQWFFFYTFWYSIYHFCLASMHQHYIHGFPVTTSKGEKRANSIFCLLSKRTILYLFQEPSRLSRLVTSVPASLSRTGHPDSPLFVGPQEQCYASSRVSSATQSMLCWVWSTTPTSGSSHTVIV